MADSTFNQLDNGHILNTNTVVTKSPTPQSKSENFSISTAHILRTLPVDHDDNKSKKRVEYDMIITSGPNRGRKIRNATGMDSFGGNENFSEFVYKARSEVLRGDNKGDSTFPEDTDGSSVYIGYLDGNFNQPVILGGLGNHNNSDYGMKESDGLAFRTRYNGVDVKIDKNGNLSVTKNNTSIKLFASGDVEINTENKTTINSTGDMTINSSGKANINSSGDATISSSTGIGFEGPHVSIGSPGASERVVLGDSFASLFNSHTHPGTGTPDQQMTSSELSSKVKVE